LDISDIHWTHRIHIGHIGHTSDRSHTVSTESISMGDVGTSQQGNIPQWFTEYINGQRQQQLEAEQTARQREEELRRQIREEEQRKITNGSKPGKSLPQLQEYHGDSEKLESWLQQAHVKLRVDYCDCTEYVKFWALAACLRGRALRRMDAWTREYGTPDQAKAETFFARMEFVFQDPQAKERATRKLGALRQGNKPFIEAYMDWQSLIIEAGGADWPDSAKKVSLDAILSDELARAMITVPTPNSFEAYCNSLKEVDDRLRAYKTRSGRPERNSSRATEQATSWRSGSAPQVGDAEGKEGKTGGAGSSFPDKMDWQPTRVAAGKARRAQWVDESELDKRRQMRLCLRCGDQGHMIRDCPHLPARRPKQAGSVRVPEGPKLEEVEEEDVHSESEKE
jgi:hypothetical protein